MNAPSAAQRVYATTELRDRILSLTDERTLLHSARSACRQLGALLSTDNVIGQLLFMRPPTNAPDIGMGTTEEEMQNFLRVNHLVFDVRWYQGFFTTSPHSQIPTMKYDPEQGFLNIITVDANTLHRWKGHNASYLDMYPSTLPVTIRLENWRALHGLPEQYLNKDRMNVRPPPGVALYDTDERCTFRELFELADRLDKVALAHFTAERRQRYEGRLRHRHKAIWTLDVLEQYEVWLGLV